MEPKARTRQEKVAGRARRTAGRRHRARAGDLRRVPRQPSRVARPAGPGDPQRGREAVPRRPAAAAAPRPRVDDDRLDSLDDEEQREIAAIGARYAEHQAARDRGRRGIRADPGGRQGREDPVDERRSRSAPSAPTCTGPGSSWSTPTARSCPSRRSSGRGPRACCRPGRGELDALRDAKPAFEKAWDAWDTDRDDADRPGALPSRRGTPGWRSSSGRSSAGKTCYVAPGCRPISKVRSPDYAVTVDPDRRAGAGGA